MIKKKERKNGLTSIRLTEYDIIYFVNLLYLLLSYYIKIFFFIYLLLFLSLHFPPNFQTCTAIRYFVAWSLSSWYRCLQSCLYNISLNVHLYIQLYLYFIFVTFLLNVHQYTYLSLFY